MIYKVLILNLLLVFSGFTFAQEKQIDDSIWVALIINEKRSQGASEYLGKINIEYLGKIISGNIKEPFFKLENVFWYDNAGNVNKLSEYQNNDTPYGYKSTVYFRVNEIYRITPLDETTLKANFEKNKLGIVKYDKTEQCNNQKKETCSIKEVINKLLE